MEFSKTFFCDLNLQLHFHSLEWVDPNKRQYKTLCAASKKYVDYYGSDKYKALSKKDQDSDIEEDLCHFIAYSGSKSSLKSSVISSDYFKVTNCYEKFEYDVITPRSVLECTNIPNKVYALSKVDKMLIKNHVKKVRNENQMEYITKIDKKVFDVELLTKDGIISESKYEYEGQDSTGKKYPISIDWVQINFQNRDSKTYKQIMNLKNGEKLKLPTGSSENSSSWPLRKKDKGPSIKYFQNEVQENSCMFFH